MTPEKIDYERFRNEANRMAGEIQPDEVTGGYLARIARDEGLEDVEEILIRFGHEAMTDALDTALRGHGPAIAGIPMLIALVIGMRLGRMQAAKAFEEGIDDGRKDGD